MISENNITNKGLIGRKVGMTQLFLDNGQTVPVTIIEVLPNVVMQVKTIEKDSYQALKLGYLDKKENKVNKIKIGDAKKANTSPKQVYFEVRNMTGFEQGQNVDVSIFKVGEYVDIQGVSKGKGFAGVIKRHHQKRGPESHGSKFHRAPGSLGSISGQVFKTKKLPGRKGGKKSTELNLSIVLVDKINNAIAVRGSVPGPKKSFVLMKKALNVLLKPVEYKLVDIVEEQAKNKLLIDAKSVGAKINSSMTIEEMKNVIAEATIHHDKEIKEKEELVAKANSLGIVNATKQTIEELKKSVDLAETLEKERLEKQALEKPIEQEKIDDSKKIEEIKLDVKEDFSTKISQQEISHDNDSSKSSVVEDEKKQKEDNLESKNKGEK